MQSNFIKEFRSFKRADFFSKSTPEFYLLPFRFIQLSEHKELIVNDLGDFLLVPSGTVEKVVDKKIDPDSELYMDLVAGHFISETPIPSLIDVMATKYRTRKSFLNGFTSLHIFVVSLRCNHSCHYCQVSRVTGSKLEYDVSFENLELAIQHMFRSPSPHLTMEFQGGEPLLAFEKVEYAILRAKELNKQHEKSLNFVVCTNSTVINDDILDFLKIHEVLISTSLDGPESLHNANRPKTGATSFNLVIEGINRFREVLGNDRVSCLMTTTVKSLDYPKEIIDTYLKYGFSNVFLRPISPYGFALKNYRKNEYETDRFLDFYKSGLEYIIELNKKGIFFTEDFTVILLQKIFTVFPVGYVDLQSPAGLINSVIVYNYDGYVYASDESRMLAENNDFTFRLGHVRDAYHSIFYGEKAKKIAGLSVIEGLAGCSDCAFQTYCGADPVYHHALFGDMEGVRPLSDFCKRNMGVFLYLFNLLDTRYDEVFPIFSSWIKHSLSRQV
jgi:His-Xaa-Ser system radical SAM maturase HxsB